MPSTPKRKTQVLRKLIHSPSVPNLNVPVVSPKSRDELELGKEVVDSLQKHISEVKPKGGAQEDKKKAYNVLVNVAAEIKARYGLKTKLKKQLHVKNLFSKKKFGKSKVRKTRKDKISEVVKKEVEEFYLRGDISKELPSKRDVCKVKDKEGNVKVLQKHLMTMTLQEAFKTYKEENPGRKIGFTSFRKFKPKQVKRVSETSRRSCLCKPCCNAALKAEALKNFAQKQTATSKIDKDQLPLFKKSKRNVANETVCPYDKETGNPKANCLNRSCDQCGAQRLISQYKTILIEVLNEKMSWYCWEYITIQKNGKDKRVTSCVAKETSVNTFLQEYEVDLKTLPSHLFRAGWQHAQMSACKKQLQPNELMMVMDYSENYSCRFQHEVQSAFFEPAQVTIHPMMLYYKKKIEDQDVTVKHAVIGVSNDSKHDSHGVKVFEEQALNIAQKEVPESLKAVHQWTDGAASQYKGKTSFADISSQHLSLTRNFFETSHGKSVCDGLGAIVKNSCFRAVLSEKTVISDSKSLFCFCKANLEHDVKASGSQEYSKRQFVFVDKDQVIRNRPEAEAKTLKGTQKLHAVRNTGKPKNILIRNLSCYCQNCIVGNDRCCLNKEHVESWSKKVIQFNADASQDAIAHTSDEDESQVDNTEDGPDFQNNEESPADNEESIEFRSRNP